MMQVIYKHLGGFLVIRVLESGELYLLMSAP